MECWNDRFLEGFGKVVDGMLEKWIVGKMEVCDLEETPVRAGSRFCWRCDIWIGEIMPKNRLNRIFQTFFCRNR